MAEKKVWFGFEYWGMTTSHVKKMLDAQDVINPQIVEGAEQDAPNAPIKEKIAVQGFIEANRTETLADKLEQIGLDNAIMYIGNEIVDKMPHHFINETLLYARDN